MHITDRLSSRSRLPFVASLAAHGDRVALFANGSETTYRDLSERVDSIASHLRPEGGRRLAMVGVRNRAGAVEAYLGALAAGHVVLLVDADDERAVQSMIATYDPDLVLLPSEEDADAWAVTERRAISAHRLHPDLALLLSTSGSTGSPKLVRLSYENLQSNAEAIADSLHLTDADRAATTLPMSYCYGLSVIHSHLVVGASLVLTELSVVDECFWKLFRTSGATSFAGVPYTFELLERVGFAGMDLPSLRYVTQAGGRLDAERVHAYAELGQANGWQFYVMYGQTEATARMAYLPPALAATNPDAVGVPIAGGSFEIDPLPDAPSGVGELVYRGPNVMLGYATRPADLALGRTVDELRTGDLARRTNNGLYQIVGRRSAFVKIRGLRIDLQQVERTLLARGLTAVCAGGDEEIVVGIETERSETDVRPIVREALGLPASAVRVVCLAQLPRLANGKPDRSALSAIARDVAARPSRATRDALEMTSGDDRVRELYSDVLARPAHDTDTFASLGGDSLSYVEASLGLEEILGHLPRRWPTMTIAQLQALAPSNARHRSLPLLRRWLSPRRIETSVALRALAIVLIVATHIGLIALPGGAHLLLAVAGYNFARFQLTATSRLERVRSQVRAIARVVAPAVLWIAALLLFTSDYELHSLFLLNGIVGSPTWSYGWQFWFIEVLTFLLIGAAVLTSLPVFDRAERRWPFAVAVAILAVGLVLRFGIVDLGVPNTKPALWLFALGWAASRADRTWQRAAVLLVAAMAVPGFFGDVAREALILGGFGLLLFVRGVPVPALTAPAVGVLATSSLYIYLVHWRVYPALEMVPQPLALAACLLAGVVVWLAVDRGTPLLSRFAAGTRQQLRTAWPDKPATERRTAPVMQESWSLGRGR